MDAFPAAGTHSTSVSSTHARWMLIASILGSGAAFLEGTVVNVALPAIGRELDLGVAGLEAVVNGYLLPLSALMLLGGALGDRFRRSRVFAFGLLGFALACAGCAIAPNAPVLVVCRMLQGGCGALLVPNSLALLETSFAGEARGVAIGQWSAWSAVSTALGPLAGGWIADNASWRWVFAIMIPFALAAGGIALRHAEAAEPRSGADTASSSVDYAGAGLVTLSLAGVVGSLTWATTRGLAHSDSREEVTVCHVLFVFFHSSQTGGTACWSRARRRSPRRWRWGWPSLRMLGRRGRLSR